MESKLDIVAKSYDKTIEYGRNGIDLYKDLPEYITNDPDYAKWKAEQQYGTSGSECKTVKDYLLPNVNMKFIDCGCCLNLMFKGYDKWPSMYYGVDISSETIKLLKEFVAKKKLNIGSLYWGSIHETPFDDNSFDIGACIGVLEYFEKDFVEKALIEMHRITNPDGKVVLDIPNIGSSSCRIMMLFEEYMGRNDNFNMLPREFEDILKNYFEIEELSESNKEAMNLMYYLRCKK